ncbi:MAG: mandelate racemase, partial [Solirubrobacterales bacterium]|nr:mandelate racemase [Solirubrobacterales bacterium]
MPGVELRVEPVTLPLAQPLRTAYGDVRVRELLLVELAVDDGVVGRG